MYILSLNFSDKGGRIAGRLADPNTFTETFDGMIGSGVTTVVDGRDTSAPAAVSVENMSFVLFAKDKSTLVKGLKSCPPQLRFTVRGGQIGYFTGAYDNEKSGGWFRARKEAGEKWKIFKATDAGKERIADGRAKRSQADQMLNRQRLFKRGYYVQVSSAIHVRSIQRHVGVHSEDLPFCTLGRLINGQVTREQAVDRLMEDLLM